MDPGAQVKPDPRSSLPSVDRLLRALEEQWPELPRWAALEAAREVLQQLRADIQVPAGSGPGTDELLELVRRRAEDLGRTHPTPVINATGIVLHTNLGRAPLSPEGAAAVARAAQGYGDLELDLATGERGNRTERVARKLCLLSGAVEALAVNNNAGAVLLALAGLARGRDVIVSRGELVEIGGSFRIPDILEASGARLVEVGTTNRTHPEDYERAIGPDTGMLLKVHPSNFEQRGFVTEVSLASLASIGERHGLPVVEDLGSGTLLDLSSRGWPAESFAPGRLRAGADLVCFSGDKLLGGPQAGILLARKTGLVAALRKHPLARALRLDKLSLAALDWTLTAYLEDRAERELPVLAQLLAPEERLEERARALARRLGSALPEEVAIDVQRDRASAGGGSLPGFSLTTWVVRVRAPCGAERCARGLRRASPPVLARIRDGAVILDVRTLLPDDEKHVESALRDASR